MRRRLSTRRPRLGTSRGCSLSIVSGYRQWCTQNQLDAVQTPALRSAPALCGLGTSRVLLLVPPENADGKDGGCSDACTNSKDDSRRDADVFGVGIVGDSCSIATVFVVIRRSKRRGCRVERNRPGCGVDRSRQGRGVDRSRQGRVQENNKSNKSLHID